MSKELKRPKVSDYLIKDMYGVTQSMDINWADYTYDLNYHIDQLESKIIELKELLESLIKNPKP